jgi:hypothetical protein
MFFSFQVANQFNKSSLMKFLLMATFLWMAIDGR